MIGGHIPTNIGYVDTTMNGQGFFVPTTVGVSIGVVAAPVNTAIPIGSASDAANVAKWINSPLMKGFIKAARLVSMPFGNGAAIPDVTDLDCYAAPWDGKVPA